MSLMDEIVERAAKRIARKRLLKSLATTPERKKLLKGGMPSINKIVEHPSVKRAYLVGSFASGKEVPGDIDILVRHKRTSSTVKGVGENWENFGERFWEYLSDPIVGGGGKKGIHVMEAFPTKVRTPQETVDLSMTGMKDILAEGRRRYGKDYKWLRLAGLVGGIGTGLTLGKEENVEASPMSEIAENIAKRAMRTTEGKVTKVVAKGVESSASKNLKGSLFNNKVIKKIVKGKGNWRYIIAEDDTVELVDKSVINSLARGAGTAKKVAEFATKDMQSKLAQAYKSLEMHRVKAKVDKELVLDYYQKYKAQIEASGNIAPKMSLVKSEGKHFTLPKDYADLLDKEKVIKKLKDL